MPAAERAERYVLSDDFPASIEGSRGHGPLYRAACELVDGFALTRAEAWPILQKYNAEKAHPPETDHQLNHKLDDAIKHHPVPSRKRLDAPPKAGPPPRPPGGDASRNGHHDGPAVGGLWAPGTPVQALDRGNFGHVVEDHGATASVHFVSPSGREHTRTFSKAELVKAGENSHAAGPPGDAPPPEPFRLGLTGSREFFGTAYTLAWHVTKLLVKGEPCVLGGPSKSLKTSVAIDLAVSLATATRFLGRFEVPAPARVILISGESGRPIIQANARAVCAARGIADPAGMEGLLWGFTLPQLTVAEHMDALRAAIVEHRAEVVIVDPFYMTLPADVDPKNMFMMGPVLSAYAEGCLALGATPVLLHHFTKKRDDPTAPPDMAELAFAGIAQWMRQWMLLARRTPFRPEEAVHSMFFCYGGSAGHCGELHLDIDTGRIDEDFGGRRWDVRITTPGEGMTQEREQHRADQLRKEEERAREAEERKARQARDDAGRMHRTMLELDRPETLSRIRGMVNLSGDRALAAVLHLEREGLARRAAVTVRTGTGAREVEGYEATTVSPF